MSYFGYLTPDQLELGLRLNLAISPWNKLRLVVRSSSLLFEVEVEVGFGV